jgi:CHAD domain-containing protein
MAVDRTRLKVTPPMPAGRFDRARRGAAEQSMAFRLDVQQPVSESLRATVDGELEAAIESLSVVDPAKRADAVHDARKRLKKARSALRLVRSALGKRTARRLNDELRAVAASLSDRRDADVLVATVESLHDRLAEQAQRDERDDDNAVQIDQLNGVRARLEAAKVNRVKWSTVMAGIDRSYRRGRKRYEAAENAGTEDLHQWRKRAKDLWYHHRLIKDAHPTVVGAFAKDAHELSDLLGDDHDLAVLRATIVHREPPAATAPVDLEPVVDLIDERRTDVQAEARRLARRLYAEKPKAFSRRTRKYLRAFADEGRATAPADSAVAL